MSNETNKDAPSSLSSNAAKKDNAPAALLMSRDRVPKQDTLKKPFESVPLVVLGRDRVPKEEKKKVELAAPSSNKNAVKPASDKSSANKTPTQAAISEANAKVKPAAKATDGVIKVKSTAKETPTQASVNVGVPKETLKSAPKSTDKKLSPAKPVAVADEKKQAGDTSQDTPKKKNKRVIASKSVQKAPASAAFKSAQPPASADAKSASATNGANGNEATKKKKKGKILTYVVAMIVVRIVVCSHYSRFSCAQVYSFW